MSLSLDPSIMRCVISTPSQLVGQLSRPDLAIQIVFPHTDVEFQKYVQPGPYSRTYYLVSIREPDDPSSDDAFAAPTWTSDDGKPVYALGAVGGMLTDLASVWYGKRFDYHGVITHESRAWLPDLSSVLPVSHHNLGLHNRKPRPDLDIELTLGALDKPLNLLYKGEPAAELDAFRTAARFYARALRAFESDPEVAFFDFIVALEVMASQIDVPSDDLYDEQARKDLAAIEASLGPALAKRVRERYRQLSRRVVYAATTLVNDTFFKGSQAQPEWSRLTRENLETHVKAAYALRSRYAHGGVPFGIWLNIFPGAEIQVGRPVLPDSERGLKETLANIPTLEGLERLVRFIILRFAHLRISKVHDGLA